MTAPSGRRFLVALVAIHAFGAILRTVQYGAMTSMWIDELAIALNVTAGSLGDLLFRPLQLGQVAPPGFLALEKIGVGLLGDGEAGLRLFPWLAGLGSLVLFWRVAARVTGGLELLAGLLAFAASPTLVWQGASVKQYSGDVFATLLLLLLAFRVDEERVGRRGAAAYGAIGGAAILASQPAVLVAAGLLIVLALRRLRSRRALEPVLLLGAGWGAGAAAVTAAALLVVSPEIRAAMDEAWRNAFPLTTEREPLFWLPERLFDLLVYFLVYVSPKSILEHLYGLLFSALVLTGAWSLARRRPGEGILLAVPPAVAIVAGLVGLLPLYNRVALYLGPVLLIGAMAGMAEIRRRLRPRMRALGTLALLGLFAAPAAAVLTLGRPPYRAEEARPVLAELASRWRPGDEIYVYEDGDFAMMFYGPDVPWVAGTPGEGDSRVHFRDIDRFRGEARVWFFHTHGGPCEPEAIHSYLEAIGTEIDRIEDPYGLRGQREAAARLYDLSDPGRLARADAESYDGYPRATQPPDKPWKLEGCGYERTPHTAEEAG